VGGLDCFLGNTCWHGAVAAAFACGFVPCACLLPVPVVTVCCCVPVAAKSV
jgi:hypothetical protein